MGCAPTADTTSLLEIQRLPPHVPPVLSRPRKEETQETPNRSEKHRASNPGRIRPPTSGVRPRARAAAATGVAVGVVLWGRGGTL